MAIRQDRADFEKQIGSTAKLELLPCPFCGGIDLDLTSGEDSDLWVYCKNCHAGISGGESNPTPDGEIEDANGLNEEDRKQCREAWNTRPTPQAAQEALKVAVEALDKIERTTHERRTQIVAQEALAHLKAAKEGV